MHQVCVNCLSIVYQFFHVCVVSNCSIDFEFLYKSGTIVGQVWVNFGSVSCAWCQFLVLSKAVALASSTPGGHPLNTLANGFSVCQSMEVHKLSMMGVCLVIGHPGGGVHDWFVCG